MSCNVPKRSRYADNSVWKSKSPAYLLRKQKHPSKNSHVLLQEINTKSESQSQVPLLSWSSASILFVSQGKHYQMQMWGLQRKTTLNPIRVLVCVLWKIRHFVSTCQHWLHNKHSYCAKEEFSQFANGNMSFLLLLWVNSHLFLYLEP